jgi:hypothetical protein
MTKDHLKVYLEHLKRMKDIKMELENIQESKVKYEEQYKAFQVVIQKRSREFQVARYLFGVYHLA